MLERWTEDDCRGLYKHPEGKWVLYEDAVAPDMRCEPIGECSLRRTRKVVDFLEIHIYDLEAGIAAQLGKTIEQQTENALEPRGFTFWDFWSGVDEDNRADALSDQPYKFAEVLNDLQSNVCIATREHCEVAKRVFGENIPNLALEWEPGDPLTDELLEMLDDCGVLQDFFFIPVIEAACKFLGKYADVPIYIQY